MDGRKDESIDRSGKLSAVADDDRLGGRAAPRPALFHLLHHRGAIFHLAKNHVLPIQPGRGCHGDEELGSVRVRSSVGHREEVWLVVLDRKTLVCKFPPVDRLPSRAVAAGEVTSLTHESRDDAVEFGALEVKRLSLCSCALFPCAQRPEIFCCLWQEVVVEGQHHPPRLLVADVNVKEDRRARGCRGSRTKGRALHFLTLSLCPSLCLSP
mmetsp:Transcript_53101/g.103917  ORF Transcript_53101/g.103917 Transcript_53101/m.103917 type:complete len:211 (-) Transcript_53101:169-801(-)